MTPSEHKSSHRSAPGRKGSTWAGPLFSLLLFLVLQEVALRIVFPIPEVIGFDRLSYSPKSSSEAVSSLSLAHASFTWWSEPDDAGSLHELNLYGFRDRTWAIDPDPDRTRVAFVGDSFTEGIMAPADCTIPSGFALSAEEGGEDLEVLNLGITGANLETYTRLLRDAAPLLRPSWVVLVIYTNDFSKSGHKTEWLADPREMRATSPWEPRLAWVVRNLSADQRIPRRWFAPPFSFIPPVPDPINPWTNRKAAARFERFVEPDLARAMREGRFNPGLPTWIRNYPKVLRRPPVLLPHLQAIKDYLDDLGIRLGVVYIPPMARVSDRYLPYLEKFSPEGSVHSLMGEKYDRLARRTAEDTETLGVPFLDLTPHLRELEANGQTIYWEYDNHMRGEGYLLVGRRIFEWWRELD